MSSQTPLLLLKTHRSVVGAKIDGLYGLSGGLSRLLERPSSNLEFEHAVAAVDAWADDVAVTLHAAFADQRITNEVSGDLRSLVARVKRAPNIIDGEKVQAALVVATGKLQRLRQKLHFYHEPPNLPPLTTLEAAQTATAAIAAFNRMAARRDVDTALPVESEPRREEVIVGPLVFISHSARDSALAGKLVNLLTSAVAPPLTKASIRCTSVRGCTLEGGDWTHDKLLAEIKASPVFVALITDLSVGSAYVLFELGARWATEQPAIPMLGPGAGYDLLPGPWHGNVHALTTHDRGAVQQLVDQVARTLGRTTQPAHAWGHEVDALVTHGAAEPEAGRNPRQAAPTPRASQRSDEKEDPEEWAETMRRQHGSGTWFPIEALEWEIAHAAARLGLAQVDDSMAAHKIGRARIP